MFFEGEIFSETTKQSTGAQGYGKVMVWASMQHLVVVLGEGKDIFYDARDAITSLCSATRAMVIDARTLDGCVFASNTLMTFDQTLLPLLAAYVLLAAIEKDSRQSWYWIFLAPLIVQRNYWKPTVFKANYAKKSHKINGSLLTSAQIWLS